MEKLVPKLRFPEFKKDWENKSFNSLYTFKSTNSFSRENLNYENGEIKNIHYGDIHTKFDSLFDITKEKVPFINLTIDISKIKEDSYVEEGDLIIADASENYDDIGKMIEVVNISNGKLVAGLHTFLAKRKNSNNAIGFTSNLVKTWNVRQQILKIAQGTKVLSLSAGRLGEITLTIPQPEEQQKIASFLTSVDERLTLLAQQKEKLELYKKGVMQQIFSQKLRFKDENGNDYPDWEEKKLGDLFNFLRGSSLSKNDLKLDGENLCIHYGELFTIHREEIKYILSRTNISGTLSKSGDILMPSSDVTPKGLATASAIFYENVIIGGDINILRPSKSLNSLYFSYYLNFSKKEIIKLVTGTTVKHIYNKDVKLLKLKVSKSIEEQQKIASFLSAIDVQIEGVSKKITQTKMFKKGLLQQLFV